MRIVIRVLARIMDRCRGHGTSPPLQTPPLLPHRSIRADEITNQELQEARERILSGLCARRLQQCQHELFAPPSVQPDRIVKFPSPSAKPITKN